MIKIKILRNSTLFKTASILKNLNFVNNVSLKRFISTDNESKQGMTKEEIEKLAEFQKMIRSQNIYKFKGASSTWSLVLLKLAKWSLLFFLLVICFPYIYKDLEGNWKIRMISPKASLKANGSNLTILHWILYGGSFRKYFESFGWQKYAFCPFEFYRGSIVKRWRKPFVNPLTKRTLLMRSL